MSDIRGRLEVLARRLAALEDEVAVQQVLARYGPAVDSGSGVVAAALWTEDGEYDAQVGSWSGRAAIAGMVAGAGHQGLIRHGAAHVLAGVPRVAVHGDSAVATAYYELHRHHDGRFAVWRVTATRWELERGPDGWHVKRRVNRLLDGADEARQLLRQAVTEDPTGPTS